MTRRARLATACIVAALAGTVALLRARAEPAWSTDLDQLWYAARALFGGRDPYAIVGPGPTGGHEFVWPWPLYYPLPAVLLVSPLALLPIVAARVLFASLSAGVLAWAITRDGWWRLPLLLSASMLIAAFLELWPVGKIPVLRDGDRAIPEATIIIEHLDRHHPGRRPLLPTDEDERLEVRLWDRFFDSYVHVPMQEIVTDRLRADGEHDPRGVANARSTLDTAYGMIERRMADRTWSAGKDFSLADCAATPALFYASIVAPLPNAHTHLAAYFERLMARPSVKRVIDEARPHFHNFPYREAMPARFLRAAGD